MGSKAGRRGAAHGDCKCSLLRLRVRGWWQLTMKSRGVEISIAGDVEEKVCVIES